MEQMELDVAVPQTTPKADNVAIKEWKTVGAQENFTVLGLGDDNKIYFWKNQIWNLL